MAHEVDWTLFMVMLGCTLAVENCKKFVDEVCRTGTSRNPTIEIHKNDLVDFSEITLSFL